MVQDSVVLDVKKLRLKMTGGPSMNRPSRDEVLMASAKIWSRRSTCSRLRVGAVFARDGRILVTGYNGAPAGLPHCDHTCNCSVQFQDPQTHEPPLHDIDCASQQPCTQAEHAERNGIAYAARYGVQLKGCEVFLTDSPCLPCAMSLVNAGVERVVYDREYRVTDGIELLQQAGVNVERYSQS